MTTYLTIDDGLRRALGYLADDDLLDDETKTRMSTALIAAEKYIQGAIGEDDDSFYQKPEIKELYTLACNAVAANWFNHPSTAVSSTTARQIISQLRGSYDESEADNGSTAKRKPSNANN